MAPTDLTAAAEPSPPRRSPAWFWVVCLIPATIYTATAGRDLLVGDTAEFLTAVLTFGVPHPSGYPLLVLVGRAFAWLPVGDLPFRANLAAVASSAGTVSLVFLTARRLGTGDLAAGLAALALAFHPLFWEWSLALEAFPLNNLLAAAVVYFLVCWAAEPGRRRYLTLATLCGALGAANHLTIVCLLPGAALVLWRSRASLSTRPSQWLALLAAVLVGLLPYAYLLWAASHHPYLNWGAMTSLRGLAAHFLRSDYGTLNLASAGIAPGTTTARMMALGASFTWFEGTLVVLGAVGAYRRSRGYFWSTALSVAVAGPGFAALANIDPAQPTVLWVLRRFFLLPHVLLAPLAAFGVVSLLQSAQFVARRRQVGALIVALGAIALLAESVVRNYAVLDQHRNHLARTFAEDILESLEPRSVLLASGEGVVFPLTYLQAVEHKRPDVTVIALGLLRRFDWYLAELPRREGGLNIPFERYDARRPSASLAALLEANPGRPFAFVGAPQDDGSLAAHWFRPRGLVSKIENRQQTFDLDAAIADNERLLRGYRVPDTATVKHKSAEAAILTAYAQAPAALGRQCALRYRNAEAAEWYRRALAIDPTLEEARTALVKLAGTRPGS